MFVWSEVDEQTDRRGDVPYQAGLDVPERDAAQAEHVVIAMVERVPRSVRGPAERQPTRVEGDGEGNAGDADGQESPLDQPFTPTAPSQREDRVDAVENRDRDAAEQETEL